MAHGWTAPAVVDPAGGVTPDALARFVEGLAALPGAEYVLAVDAEGERVRGEAGGPPEADLAVLAWARRVASVSQERRQAFEDLVLTTDTAFHLVRLVPVDPEAADDEAAWVTVRIDRTRGNLAWSRRTLAGMGTRSSVSGPRALPAAPSAIPELPAAPQPDSLPAPGRSGSTPLATPLVVPAPSGPSSSPAASPDSHRSSPRFAPFEPSTPVAPASRSSWPSSPPRSSSWVSRPATGTVDEDRPSGPRTPAGGWPTARTPVDAFPDSGAIPVVMSAPAVERTERKPEVPSPRTGPDQSARPAWPTREDREAAATRSLRGSGVRPGLAWPRREDRDAAARQRPAFTTLPERSAAPESVFEATEATEAPEATETPVARRLPLTVRQASQWRESGETGEPTGTAEAEPVVEAAAQRTVVPVPAAPAGWVPTARTSTESAPAPSVPAPRTSSLFTPVTVPPPPMPEPDTGEMALPLPSPAVIVRPYAPKPAAAPAPEPAAAPAPEPEPAPVPDPEPAADTDPDPDESDDLPDLPRRRPGANLAPGLPATPRTAPAAHPVPAVAGAAAFSTEHSVLRRLLDGLRRLS